MQRGERQKKGKERISLMVERKFMKKAYNVKIFCDNILECRNVQTKDREVQILLQCQAECEV